MTCSRLPAGGARERSMHVCGYWPGLPAHGNLHVHGREGLFARGCACVATLGRAPCRRAGARLRLHKCTRRSAASISGGRGLAPINPCSLLGRFFCLRGCPLWYDDRLARTLWERTAAAVSWVAPAGWRRRGAGSSSGGRGVPRETRAGSTVPLETRAPRMSQCRGGKPGHFGGRRVPPRCSRRDHFGGVQ